MANAGPDQGIILPVDSVFLDGSQSRDPNGDISRYEWAKIAGPNSFNIKNTTADKTWATGLVEGVYEFELKVTDGAGLFSKDTVRVAVVAPGHPNQPPHADAGPDQTIFLPVVSTILDGGNSVDTDGIIAYYSWNQVSGPSQCMIGNPANVLSSVTNLMQGIYVFNLTVVDNLGAADSDTVSVIVKPTPDSISVVNAQLTWIQPLSIWRLHPAVATAGTKILFAGGYAVDYNGEITGVFSRVDIYDFISNTWSTAELSTPRYNIVGASADGKVLFAGGIAPTGVITSRVDIYDVAANSWTTAELSQPGESLAAASSGDKILFAGEREGSVWDYNGPSNLVDIYDASSNNWSTSALSQLRSKVIGATAGGKVLFVDGIGGIGTSQTADIYNVAGGNWSTAALSQANRVSAAASAGNSIIFARSLGGTSSASSNSKRIDIFDALSGKWSKDSLDRFDFLSDYAHDIVAAAAVGPSAVFIPSDLRHFIIYDVNNGTWSITPELSNPFGWETSIIAANNQIYIAGWEGVWRLQL